MLALRWFAVAVAATAYVLYTIIASFDDGLFDLPIQINSIIAVTLAVLIGIMAADQRMDRRADGLRAHLDQRFNSIADLQSARPDEITRQLPVGRVTVVRASAPPRRRRPRRREPDKQEIERPVDPEVVVLADRIKRRLTGDADG